MPDPNRLLVVSHPILANIGRDEIERAVPESQRAGGWDLVEIVPLRAARGRLHEIDWAEALGTQEQAFTEHLLDKILSHHQLAYFGFAPIPLALHLGFRVENGIKIDVYQRHHVRKDWLWTLDDMVSTQSLMKPLNLPEHGSRDQGSVVIRVSTSYRIAPVETAGIVPDSLAEVDVALANPGLDALKTRSALDEVMEAFHQALSWLKHLFPNLTKIHLFAAVPVGLAFRLGTEISPTINRDVVTYQYWAKGSPCYQQAIVLTENGGTASSRTVPGNAAYSGAAHETGFDSQAAIQMPELPGTFLDDTQYDWSKPEAVEFYDIMLSAYASPQRAHVILGRAQIHRASIHFEQPARDFWKQALEVAAIAGRTRKLAQSARSDPLIAGYHLRLDRLTNHTR